MTGVVHGDASRARDTTLLGLVRVLLAALLLKNTLKLWLDLQAQGYFGDFFFIPVLDPAWVPSARGYELLLGLKLAACACALLGLWARPALLTAACVGLYLLLCDRLQYHNNRYATHLLAFLLAFAPCDRSFNLVSRMRVSTHEQPPGAPGPWWAARLMQMQMSAIYLASGGGKLLDDDWRGGIVMGLRFSRAVAKLAERGVQLPNVVFEAAQSSLLGSIVSKAAIATELFLAVGLWHPVTRVFALWLGVMFHLGIQLSANVDLFSWLMLGGYVLFATPELRERTFRYNPRWRAGRVLAHVLPALDWLMRFRRAPAGLDAAFEIEARDGRVQRGYSAFPALCRAIPALFPLWLPLRFVELAVEVARARRVQIPLQPPG